MRSTARRIYLYGSSTLYIVTIVTGCYHDYRCQQTIAIGLPLTIAVVSTTRTVLNIPRSSDP